MSGGLMQIGEVAERVGLSLRTIRYWDEVGLVVPSERSTGGFRLYNDADLARLALVKKMKPLDLTIDEMRDLVTTLDAISSSAGGIEPEDPLLARLAMFRAMVDARLEKLRIQLDELDGLSHELGAVANRAVAPAAPPVGAAGQPARSEPVDP